MSDLPKILIVEDDPAISGSLRRALGRNGFEVVCVARGDDGLARARDGGGFDAVLTDFKLPGLSGIELAAQLHASNPLLPVIVMTAHGSTETAIEATKVGAYDYLLKPFEVEELLDLVAGAVATRRLASEPVELGLPVARHDALIGNSRAMQNVYKEIGRIAAKPVSVLIRGETGTGKELIARAIHQHGDRAGRPFVAVNCAAIPETLLESELFGHERGAFTGAEGRRIGRFEQAHQGTIFLDEIGELSPGTQAKLLRVLQEHSIQRVGGKETLPLDIRVLAATHRDLEAAIAGREFREDLYYRLGVVEIRVPPLRERPEDIPLLVQYFLQRYAPDLGPAQPSMTLEAVEFLQQQPWPGNVRELENSVRKAMLLARGYAITLDHARQATQPSLPPERAGEQTVSSYIAEVLAAAERGEVQDAQRTVLQAVECELYSQAIARAGGNLSQAARWLGVTRVTMREKLAAFGLRPTVANEPGPGPDALSGTTLTD